MTYHSLNGRDYGHVTIFRFLPFVVMQRVVRVCQRQLILVKLRAIFDDDFFPARLPGEYTPVF